MKLKTLIVDDEPLARERMRMLLAQDADVQVVGECRNGRETLACLRETAVDLLLLDIQMPGKSGFDVLAEMVEQPGPAVIFVTAFHEHALRAFDVHAVDYLVKPVQSDRLQAALARAKRWVGHTDGQAMQQRMAAALRMLEEAAAGAEKYPQRLLVKNGSADMVVQVNEIEWIEAADYYVCLHVREREHLLRESIKAMEEKLDPRKFVRLHRSAIVNVEQVREIHRDGRAEGWVRLASGGRVRMNQRGWQRLAAMPGLG